MSPQRQFSLDSRRQPTKISDIFLGLAFRVIGPDTDEEYIPANDQRKQHKQQQQQQGQQEQDGDKWTPGEIGPVTHRLEGTFVMHDGTGIVGSETMAVPLHEHAPPGEQRSDVKHFKHKLFELINELSTKKNTNVRMIAIAEPIPEMLRAQGLEFSAKVWLHMDAIPFITTPKASMFKNLPASSTQANATSAVQAGVKTLHPATHSATVAECSPQDHHVLVDCDGQVRLCRLPQYRDTTSPQLWKRFMALATHLKERSISVSFFSATPQGGGVALMRHALIRLWRLVGLDVRWYTPEGHPAIFDITKRKIHNVLQGVSKPGEEMSEKDQDWFQSWTQCNYEMFWKDGALDADVIVIDDPQLTALIPIIREKRPDAKIIFRSHIQIQSDLTDKPDTAQHRTWNFLFNFVKQADLLLAHPVKFFVPANVRENMPVLYMAPSTDPIDGLNKPYGKIAMRYYRELFNSLSAKQCGVEIDWDREYICQIARFDPSKGIPDLIKAFLEFRNKLDETDSAPIDGAPQLIIMGHGSIDDPDGTVVYEELHDILGGKEYEDVRQDVAIVRAPPSDSLLGAILQGAWVATQLSTREGFEVKVTEAIHKRVPMIASDAGGIPLQVKHGKNGWIVKAGDTSAVASLLFDIYTDKISVQRDTKEFDPLEGGTDPNAVAEAFVSDLDAPLPPVQSDKNGTSEDFWTVGNATRWMLLFSKILGLPVESTATEEGYVLPIDNGGMDIPSYMSQEFREIIRDMGVGEKLLGKGEEGGNVWKMVMGQDLVEGEGELI